jgi:hypothetical protein
VTLATPRANQVHPACREWWSGFGLERYSMRSNSTWWGLTGRGRRSDVVDALAADPVTAVEQKIRHEVNFGLEELVRPSAQV